MTRESLLASAAWTVGATVAVTADSADSPQIHCRVSAAAYHPEDAHSKGGS